MLSSLQNLNLNNVRVLRLVLSKLTFVTINWYWYVYYKFRNLKLNKIIEIFILTEFYSKTLIIEIKITVFDKVRIFLYTGFKVLKTYFIKFFFLFKGIPTVFFG